MSKKHKTIIAEMELDAADFETFKKMMVSNLCKSNIFGCEWAYRVSQGRYLVCYHTTDFSEDEWEDSVRDVKALVRANKPIPRHYGAFGLVTDKEILKTYIELIKMGGVGFWQDADMYELHKAMAFAIGGEWVYMNDKGKLAPNFC